MPMRLMLQFKPVAFSFFAKSFKRLLYFSWCSRVGGAQHRTAIQALRMRTHAATKNFNFRPFMVCTSGAYKHKLTGSGDYSTMQLTQNRRQIQFILHYIASACTSIANSTSTSAGLRISRKNNIKKNVEKVRGEKEWLKWRKKSIFYKIIQTWQMN